MYVAQEVNYVVRYVDKEERDDGVVLAVSREYV